MNFFGKWEATGEALTAARAAKKQHTPAPGNPFVCCCGKECYDAEGVEDHALEEAVNAALNVDANEIHRTYGRDC